jgi:hypothetical protein
MASCDCKGPTPYKPNNEAEVEKLQKELAVLKEEELELLGKLRAKTKFQAETEEHIWKFFKKDEFPKNSKLKSIILRRELVKRKQKTLDKLEEATKSSTLENKIGEIMKGVNNPSLRFMENIALAADTTLTYQEWKNMNGAPDHEKMQSLTKLVDLLKIPNNITLTREFLAAWLDVLKNYEKQAELKERIQKASTQKE